MLGLFSELEFVVFCAVVIFKGHLDQRLSSPRMVPCGELLFCYSFATVVVMVYTCPYIHCQN